MTLHVQTTVVCDGPATATGGPRTTLGCGAYMAGTVSIGTLPSREKIRAKARFMGWVVRSYGVRDYDLCPEHSHLLAHTRPDGTVEFVEAPPGPEAVPDAG
jgi:hypothetical protein